MQIIQRIFLCFVSCLLCFPFGCKNRNSVTNYYKFPDTKSVQVQVSINFKLAPGSGPDVALANQDLVLNAFAIDADGEQVPLAPLGQNPILDLPITMSGPHLDFEALLLIPVTVQPRESGYAFKFQLKPASTSLKLEDAASLELSALRGGVQAGTAPASNLVEINLATTLAASFALASLTDPGSDSALSAYASLVTQLSSRLATVEAQADASKSQDLLVYGRAIKAGLEYQVLTDKTFQSDLVSSLSTGDAAAVAIGLSSTLASFATDVSTYLGSSTTKESAVFPSGTIDPANVPSRSSYSGSVYAPLAVAYQAATITATGAVTITPPTIKTGIASYNVYFGGSGAENSHGQLLGNVLATASPLRLSLPAGTTVPSGMGAVWVYPVTQDGTELKSPASVSVVGGPAVHLVTLTPSANLTLSPSTIQGVANGATVTVTLTPGSGYGYSKWVGGTCPRGSWSGSKYTTGAIVSDCTVTLNAAAAFSGISAYPIVGYDAWINTPSTFTLDENGNLYAAYTANGDVASGSGPSASGQYDGIVVKRGPSGTRLWATQISAAGGSYFQIMSLVRDSTGALYACGDSDADLNNHVSTPGGTYWLSVAKLNPANGSVVWIRQWTVNANATSCAVDSADRLFLTGYTSGNLSGSGPIGAQDGVLMRINSAGTADWIKQFGVASYYNAFASLKIDQRKDVIYVIGAGGGNPQTNGPATNGTVAFVTKFDKDGNIIWHSVHDVGGGSQFYYDDLDFDAATNKIYAVAHGNGDWTSGALNASGRKDFIIQELTDQGTSATVGSYVQRAPSGSGFRYCSMGSIRLSNDGSSLLISGDATGYCGTDGGGAQIGTRDGVVGKYDLQLNVKWIKNFGVSSKLTSAGSVIPDSTDNVLFMGMSNGNTTTGSGASTAGGSNFEVFIRSYSPLGVLN